MVLAVTGAPKPPRNTLATERFMALHMMSVRIMPLAPTKAPATISRLFCTINPEAQAAMPEYEFNRQITTGMSAPPIGITNMIPRASARADTIPRYNSALGADVLRANKMPSSRVVPTTAEVTICWPVYMMGLPEMNFSSSLAQAMREPEKVMAPITAVSHKMAPPKTSCAGWAKYSAQATNKLAKPPNPFNKPTICGIPVMGVR